MDNIILSRRWVQGTPVTIDNLTGTAFTGEAQAHTFRISGVDAAGADVQITGTVTGAFLAPNNTTIPLTGTLTDGVAEVTLTSQCYELPGRFILSVYAANGDTNLCIYCGVGYVFCTETDQVAYPSAAIPDISQLIQEAQDVIDSIPEDYSALSAHFPATGKFVVGTNTSATEENAVAEGEDTIASGLSSHAEGYASEASGDYSHSEGGSVASGGYSHAEGSASEASGENAHAEGLETTASGDNSHSEGWGTTSSGMNAHAEGVDTVASGNMSHSEGEGTIANHAAQSVSGTYNVADPSQAAATAKGNYAEIVGNGTADNARSNARTLDWSGNEALSGDLTINKNGANEMTVGEELSDLKSKISNFGLVIETNAEFSVTGKYIKPNTGVEAGASTSVITDFIPITGQTIKYHLWGNTATALIAFYTTNAASGFISAISGDAQTAAMKTGEAEVPATATYYRAAAWDYATRTGQYATQVKVNNLDDFDERLDDLTDDLSDAKSDIQSNTDILATKLDQVIEPSKPYPNQGFLNSTGVIAGTGYDSYVTDFIPIEDTVSGIDYYLNHAGTTALMIAFYSEYNPSNALNAFISGVVGTGDVGTMHKGTAVIPNGAKSFRAAQWNISGVTDYYVRKRYTLDSLVSGIDANDKQSTDNTNNIKTISLKESIYKPFDFAGKKITAFGDSITSGVTSPGLVAGMPYIRYFADHVGATLNNMAISGSKIADDGRYSIYNRITITFSGETDFIVIAGGTNDFNSGVELGSFDSTAGTSTFYGALKGICEYLATNYSTTPVIFITPIPYTNKDENTPNTAGYTLNQYRQAIYEIGTLYGHSVVNGADLGMPTKPGGWGNAMCDDTDGCHPTEDGHKLMARSLAGKLL